MFFTASQKKHFSEPDTGLSTKQTVLHKNVTSHGVFGLNWTHMKFRVQEK